MGENIEVKDVQKTEYLDKNGLDMLWAKVKENTHNQVEVERNRAVAKENSIVDTKADKSEFSNYVPSATFTALEKKVSANTAAISNKQNAGNYLHYETLNEGYYEIPPVCISESDAKLKAILSPCAFQVLAGDLEGDGETGVVITSNDRDPYIALTDSANRNTLKITREGISNTDNNANHVYATDGSIADLTQYAKKTELPTVPTKTSQLTNDSNFITSADVDLTPYATTEALAAVDQRVAANTTAIANINKSNGIPYNPSVTNYYEVNKPFYIKCDNDHTAYINPFSGIKVANNDTSYVDIIPSLLKLSNGDKTFEINQYIGGIQALDGTSNDSAGFKLNYSGLRIGKKSDINANNNELIFISVPFNNATSSFKVNPYNGITLQTGNSQIALSLNGVSLPNGDTNHVLTSAATTIDINNYVLKSVYDEKIAALEARIAALEAKYTEATA